MGFAGKRGAAAALAAGILAACAPVAPVEPGLNGPSAGDLARLVAPASPPAFVARTRDEIAPAAFGAMRADAARLAGQPRSRRVEVAAAPWLRASLEGAAFLATPAPRALVRGEPPEACPAAAASPPGAPDRRAAAEAALGLCLDRLAALGKAAGCGCRLMAADEALLAPLEAFVFAPGAPALLLGPDAPIGLVAAALPPQDGVERVALRDAAGLVALLVLDGDRAALAFAAAPQDVYEGRRTPFGWRRGRLAERIVFDEPDATLLLNVGPEDAPR